MNDDTYEEVVTFKLSRLSVYIGMSTMFVLLVGLTVARLAKAGATRYDGRLELGGSVSMNR